MIHWMGHHFYLVKDQSNISFPKFFDKPLGEYNIGMVAPDGYAVEFDEMQSPKVVLQ